MALLPVVYGDSDRQLIRRTEDWYSSMPEFGLDSADDTAIRAKIGIYRRRVISYPYPGHPGEEQPQPCLRRFYGFQVQQLTLADSEAVQTLMSDEGEKIYAFDRTVRVATMTGFIYDTDTDLLDPETARKLQGMHGLSEWGNFYEAARLSRLAASGDVVRVIVNDLVFTGGFVSSSRSMDATNAHRMNLVIQLLCSSIRPARLGRSVLRTIPGMDVSGRLTAEGAASAGLLPQLIVDPRPDQLFVSRLPGVESLAGTVLRPPEEFLESASVDRSQASFEV